MLALTIRVTFNFLYTIRRSSFDRELRVLFDVGVVAQVRDLLYGFTLVYAPETETLGSPIRPSLRHPVRHS